MGFKEVVFTVGVNISERVLIAIVVLAATYLLGMYLGGLIVKWKQSRRREEAQG